MFEKRSKANETDDESMNRRRFLAATGLLGVSTLIAG
jgi:hypothetical protein